MQEVAPETHSVEDLRDLVSEYLRSEYRPGDHGLGEVGFHITGYDRTNRPRFFYEVWGWHRPLKETQTQPEYISGGYDLKGEEVRMVYNGRSEIAERVINALIEEIGAHPGEVLLWPDRPHDLTRLGDLIARFASELTPEVGPPFTTYLISRTNQVEYIRNQDRCPIALDEVEDRLKRMGFTWNPLA